MYIYVHIKSYTIQNCDTQRLKNYMNNKNCEIKTLPASSDHSMQEREILSFQYCLQVGLHVFHMLFS